MPSPSPTWSLQRGATLVLGGVRFSVWAPNCERVAVALAADDGAREVAMERHGPGVWEAEVLGCRAGDRYRFVVEGPSGRQELPDPASRSQPGGVHEWSEVVDPRAFAWTDGAWTGREMAELVIYELHVGTFTEEGTFDGVTRRLRELKELGVTAIELMPVAEFPGGRNWGYDGVCLYAPHSAYGGPEGLRRLVDAAHAVGIAVVLDVVYNHVGPEGNYLGVFGPYFTDRYRTPWGTAVNYDGPDSDEVRRFVVDNALHWITEYHVDALRLDAVHAIFDLGARHILDEIAAAVHAQGRLLGRRTLVIAESDLNDPRLIRAAERGGYALDGQWSDDFHHAVHAALTGEQRGYYLDFGGVGPVAAALRQRFVYDGRYSAHRRRRHGAPATDVPGDRFVICLQNHDQVGNRAAGDRLSALVSFDRLKLAAALMLLAPYVPMLFMGEEYGEERPFQYFVSHGDEQLVEAVRKGRREEFAAFVGGGGDEVPDPQDAATFQRSTLDPAQREHGTGAALHALYRDLLRLRREERALRPGAVEPRVESDDASWIAMELRAEGAARGARGAADGGPLPDGSLLAIFNLSDEARAVPVPETHDHQEWQRVLSTDDAAYAVPSTPSERGGAWVVQSPPGESRPTLPLGPFTAALYRLVRNS